MVYPNVLGRCTGHDDAVRLEGSPMRPEFPRWVQHTLLSDVVVDPVTGAKTNQWDCVGYATTVSGEETSVTLLAKSTMSERAGVLSPDRAQIRISGESLGDVFQLSDDDAMVLAGQLINHVATVRDQSPYGVAKECVNRGFAVPFAELFDRHGSS